MFVALVVTLSSTLGVVVSVEAGTPCIEREAFETRLTRDGVSNERHASIRLSPLASGVLVEMRKAQDAPPDTRVVPTKGEDCRVVERVLATLVIAWSKSHLAGPPVAKPSAPTASDAPTSMVAPLRTEPMLAQRQYERPLRVGRPRLRLQRSPNTTQVLLTAARSRRSQLRRSCWRRLRQGLMRASTPACRSNQPR